MFGDQTELIDINLHSQQTYEGSASCSCGRHHGYGGSMISFVKHGLEVSISIKKQNVIDAKSLWK